MRRPRLNVLRTFEAAGRRLSFSIAATELNISQAAVSQQIRLLETQLGAALFTRHHRLISLTDVGRAYFDEVHEALQRLDTATDQLFAEQTQQTVIIRCTSSVATLWLAPEIRTFQTRHPNIGLQIQTLEQSADDKQNLSADLDVFVSGTTDHGPDVRPLLTSILTPVAAPGYLEQRKISAARDMANLDLIHILGYTDDWQSWFLKQGISGVEIPRGLSVDSSLIALDAALRGEGAFLGRRPFIDSFLRSGALVELSDWPEFLRANYYLRLSTNARNMSSKNKVADWLFALAAQT